MGKMNDKQRAAHYQSGQIRGSSWRGGMGTVFGDAGTQIGHPIAFKQLRPELAVKNPDLVPRFTRPHRLGVIPRHHRATPPGVV